MTPNAFDDAGKKSLVAAITEAACRAESVPDRPESRIRALVLLGELAPGGNPGEGRADAARTHEEDSHAEDPNQSAVRLLDRS